MVDELAVDDTDYILSSAAPSADTVKLALSSITVPAAGVITLYVRACIIPTPATLTFEVREGTTLITSWSVPITTDITSFEHAFTAGEKAAITDWSTLRAYLVADGAQMEVEWLEVEVPE
jgi:hypothetical protein